MHLGPLLTSVTIWIALLGYFVGLAGIVLSKAYAQWYALTRWVWTVACLFYLAHVVCAFHYYHNWSHATAVFDTARQTREVLGAEVGFGIYMTYLFTLLWIVDASWWWLKGHKTYLHRPKAIATAIHLYMLFIVINGAVVFEDGLVRWFSLAALAGLAALWWRYRKKYDHLRIAQPLKTQS